MELNEMEKKLLFQVEGDYQTKILNELYMTVRYSNNSEQREAAEGLMAKLRVLSNAECMDLVKDIQKNYRLPYPARTIGEKIAEARQQSGAEKLKGHDIMALERFDPEVKHSLEAMRQGSIDGEQKAYEIVVAAAKQWEQQAAATQTINRALEYLRTPEIEHTGNQWKDTDNWRADQKISNRVYQMTCSIWEDTKYDRETKQSVPIAWYVTWEVRIHSPKQGYGAKIAGQNQKRYTDKNAAIKYLDGRKKAYSHLFTEISPPIPKEYEHHFMVHGTLLPGYTVEGLEQAKTEHAAAEVSEGGIFTPKNWEKPSVLGKLSVAKTQEKTPTTPGTAMKKKEDIQL